MIKREFCISTLRFLFCQPAVNQISPTFEGRSHWAPSSSPAASSHYSCWPGTRSSTSPATKATSSGTVIIRRPSDYLTPSCHCYIHTFAIKIPSPSVRTADITFEWSLGNCEARRVSSATRSTRRRRTRRWDFKSLFGIRVSNYLRTSNANLMWDPVHLQVLSRVTSRLFGLGFLAFVSLTPGAYIVSLTAMIILKRPGYSW